jgi:hypothetical protein
VLIVLLHGPFFVEFCLSAVRYSFVCLLITSAPGKTEENLEVIFYPTLLDFRKSFTVRMCPGFARLSFWQEQHDVCGAVVEW